MADETLLAHEVALNTDYELIVTTLGGLCRYRIGDVVRVVGRHGTAPLVEFRYRRGQLLNLRGEKTSEPQLAAALSATFDGRTLMEYTTVEAIPPRGLPFYRIFVADSRSPRDGRHLEVVGHFDPIPGACCMPEKHTGLSLMQARLRQGRQQARGPQF